MGNSICKPSEAGSATTDAGKKGRGINKHNTLPAKMTNQKEVAANQDPTLDTEASQR